METRTTTVNLWPPTDLKTSLGLMVGKRFLLQEHFIRRRAGSVLRGPDGPGGESEGTLLN